MNLTVVIRRVRFLVWSGPALVLAITGAFICLAGSAVVRPFTAMCAGIALIAVWNVRRKWPAIARFLCYSAIWAAIVITSMAIQNRLEMGSYTQSPYSVDSGAMASMSFRPGDLLESLIRNTPRRLVDTGSTSFPYIYLLAMYGLWRRRRERVVWAFALVFLFLVMGHTVEAVDSGSPIGKRYYLEGFFAVALLAAVGWVELIKDLRLTAQPN